MSLLGDEVVELLFRNNTISVSVSPVDHVLQDGVVSELSEVLGHLSKVLEGDEACLLSVEGDEDLVDLVAGFVVGGTGGHHVEELVELDLAAAVLVQLGNQLVGGHAGSPLLLRLQVDDRLEHLGRRRVGRGVGTARLAVDRADFREALDDLVLCLQHLGGLGDRHARQRGRHVQQRAFVERRHELAAQLRGRVPGHAHRDQGQGDGDQLPPHDTGDDGPVDPDQEAVDRVLVLRNDSAPHEDDHQRWHQRYRQQRRRRHRGGNRRRHRRRGHHPGTFQV